MASKREVSIIIRAIDRASRVMRGISNAATKDLTQIGNAAKSAATSIGLIGAALSLSLGLVVNTTAEFQQSMANTQSVIGATVEELGLLTDAAREMGKASVFSASQAADAMYFLASAGLNTEKVIAALGGTMDLAAATMSELSFTTETVVSTLAAFGLQASDSDRVANVFAATISGSQATMERLSTAMSFVAPVANAVNLSLEETSAILGRLFTSGIGASTAGTALRMAFSQLLKPTGDAKKALDRLGVVTKTSDGNIRNFIEIIRDLEVSGLTAADAMTIFGTRAGPALLTLVNQGASAIDDLTKKVTGTNKAAEMAATQIKTFKGQMKLLKSASQELQIVIGTELLPLLTDLTVKLTGIITKTAEWAKEHKALTKVLGTSAIVITGLAVTLSGIGFAIFGITQALAPLAKAFLFIGTKIKSLLTIIKPVTSVITAFGASIGVLAVSLAGGIIGTLGLFAGALGLFRHQTEKAREDVFQTTQAIKNQQSNIEGIVAELADYEKALQQVTDAQKKGTRAVSLLGTALNNGKGGVDGLSEAILPVEEQVLRLRKGITKLKEELQLAGGNIFFMNRKLSEAPAVIRALFNPLKLLGEALVTISKNAKLSADNFKLMKEEMEFLKAESPFLKGTQAARDNMEAIAKAAGKLKALATDITSVLSPGGGSGTSLETRESFQDLQKRFTLMERFRKAFKPTFLEIEPPAPLPLPVPSDLPATIADQEAFTRMFLEAQGKMKEVELRRLEDVIEIKRALGIEEVDLEAFRVARTAQIEAQFISERQQQINDLEKERIASEGRVQDIISSMRVSAFQMEQNRINKLGQSYSGFIRSAISIGRQFFSEQEAGWIRALAATIRFVSRMVGGFLRGRALEKLKQAEQAKTASQALFQEALLLTKIGIRFALLLDFARASAAFAAAGQAASEAVLLSGQVAGLQTEAAGLMIAATAVEAAGAVAAGGLDLAADAVRRRVREEEKLARDTERRLDTELRLKQQIFELEGRTSEAKKLGIADEVSQLRELKVDENLIKQFEQLSIAQANLDTNSAGINTSASTNTMIRNAASDIANAGQIASSGLEDAVDSARRITRDGQDHFMDVGLELETTLTNLAIAVESAGQIAASGIQNVADAAQNINLGGNIVTQFEQSPIIDIIDNIGTALSAIAEKFTIAMESIKNAPTGIVDLLNSTAIGIDTLMNTIIADISEMANTAGEMIITGMQNISIPSIEFNDDLVKQFEQSPIVDAVKMIGDSLDIIVEKFITAMESIKDAGTSTLDLLSSVASNIGIQSNSIHDNVASIADAVNENILSGMQNIVIPNIEFDDDIIKQFDESPLVDSMDRVSDALDTIVEKFVISMESIKSAATGVVDFLKTITTGIEIQSNALQTQAIAMADMAKSIEMAGTIAASGIDQSTMAVNNATQQEIASNKETARQLGTELQLRQQIFNSEKDASASRQIAIENEISKLGQIGIDDSLQESLNQLSLSQTSTQITDAIMTQIRSQIGALESEAFVITNATKAIKTTGEAVASGIKLASDAALNATRQEMEHGREVERSLNTELQLRQRISVTEGQTFDARRLAIQDEMANFREMGIDENLLRRFERVATEQPQESTGVVVTDTGLTPAGLNSNTPTTPQTVVTQHNTFIGIADIEDQSMLREFARQLSPFLDDIDDLDTSP